MATTVNHFFFKVQASIAYQLLSVDRNASRLGALAHRKYGVLGVLSRARGRRNAYLKESVNIVE